MRKQSKFPGSHYFERVKWPYLIFAFFSLYGICFSKVLYEYRADPQFPDTDLVKHAKSFSLEKHQVFKSSSAITIDFSKTYEDNDGSVTFSKSYPLQNSLCFGFQFAFKDLAIKDTLKNASLPKEPDLGFLNFMSDFLQVKGTIVTYISYGLLFKENRCHLQIRLENSKEKRFVNKRPVLLFPETPYCLEFLMTLDADSIPKDLVFRLNGKKIWQPKDEMLDIKIYSFALEFGNLWPSYRFKGKLYFDNIAIGDDWLGSPPQKPLLSSIKPPVTIRPQTIRLFSPAFKSFIIKNRHLGSRYQIQSIGKDWPLPYYDSDLDSLKRDSIDIELVLSPGENYQWRVKHYSDIDIHSDWSEPADLPMDEDERAYAGKMHPKIISAAYSKPDNNEHLNKIHKDRWYDFVTRLSLPKGWENLGYACFWMNNSDYPFGSQKTKGGKFLKKSSYVYNFSYDPVIVFEKRTQGSFKNTNITTKQGLYMDASKAYLQFNPKDSTIQCRVKFLNEAKAGQWCIRGFFKNAQEISSPLYYSTFKLLPKKVKTTGIRTKIILLIGLLTCFFIVLGIFARLRAKKDQKRVVPLSKEAEAYKKVEAYVNENLKKEISIRDLEEHMGMNASKIYRIIKKAGNKSIKKLILDVKIEKAKELLSTTNKSVAEVMVAVGFYDSAHFSMTFKKYTGKSPSDFRKSKW